MTPRERADELVAVEPRPGGYGLVFDDIAIAGDDAATLGVIVDMMQREIARAITEAVAAERAAFLALLDEPAAGWPASATAWESCDVPAMARADLAREIAAKVRART